MSSENVRVLDTILPQNILFRELISNHYFSPYVEIELGGNPEGIEFTHEEEKFLGLVTYSPKGFDWLEIASVYGVEIPKECISQIYASSDVRSFNDLFENHHDTPLLIVYFNPRDSFRDPICRLIIQAALKHGELQTEFLILGSLLYSPTTDVWGMLSIVVNRSTNDVTHIAEERLVPLSSIDERLKRGAHVLLVKKEE